MFTFLGANHHSMLEVLTLLALTQTLATCAPKPSPWWEFRQVAVPRLVRSPSSQHNETLRCSIEFHRLSRTSAPAAFQESLFAVQHPYLKRRCQVVCVPKDEDAEKHIVHQNMRPRSARNRNRRIVSNTPFDLTRVLLHVHQNC